MSEESGGEDDGEVGTAMERSRLGIGDDDVGGHVDKVAEDLSRLRVVGAAHAVLPSCAIEPEARTRSAMSKSTLKPTLDDNASM